MNLKKNIELYQALLKDLIENGSTFEEANASERFVKEIVNERREFLKKLSNEELVYLECALRVGIELLNQVDVNELNDGVKVDFFNRKLKELKTSKDYGKTALYQLETKDKEKVSEALGVFEVEYKNIEI